MSHPVILILIGVVVGIYSGLLGLGGGTIMIPIMIFLLAFTPKEAVGTSLAVMILAVIPAVVEHYRNGYVKPVTAAWMVVGMAVGSYFGARIAHWLPSHVVQLIFGFVLIFVAAQTVFGKTHLLRSTLLALVLVALAAGMYLAAQRYDKSKAGASTPSTVPTTAQQ